jgi:hypothetical protein
MKDCFRKRAYNSRIIEQEEALMLGFDESGPNFVQFLTDAVYTRIMIKFIILNRDVIAIIPSKNLLDGI